LCHNLAANEPPSSPWHRLGPILTLAGCIEDHHENDSQRAPLCRSITSSSTG
jgi:hypothetical protein